MTFVLKGVNCDACNYRYDEDHDNYIDFNELKRMMEKLGEAQTHITLKNMLKLVIFVF